jgi:hypothetical protein
MAVSPKYKVFTQRPMTVTYENGTKTTSGNVEFMIAKGIQTPKNLFSFCTNTSPKNGGTTTHLGNF